MHEKTIVKRHLMYRLKCYIKYLLFENGKPLHVKYKLWFKDEGTIISIRGVETRDCSRNQVSGDSAHLPVRKQCRKTPKLSIEKKNDFISMLKFMPQQDRDYFEIACQLPTNKKSKRVKVVNDVKNVFFRHSSSYSLHNNIQYWLECMIHAALQYCSNEWNCENKILDSV